MDTNLIPSWEFRRGTTTDGPATVWAGNVSRKLYHASSCPNERKVSAKNRMEFEDGAVAKGFMHLNQT